MENKKKFYRVKSPRGNCYIVMFLNTPSGERCIILREEEQTVKWWNLDNRSFNPIGLLKLRGWIFEPDDDVE